MSALTLPETGWHFQVYRYRFCLLFKQGGDGTRLEKEQLSSGQRPFDVLRYFEMCFYLACQLGYRLRLDSIDGILRSTLADCLISFYHPLVRGSLSGDQAFPQSFYCADEHFITVAGDR